MDNIESILFADRGVATALRGCSDEIRGAVPNHAALLLILADVLDVPPHMTRHDALDEAIRHLEGFKGQ